MASEDDRSVSSPTCEAKENDLLPALPTTALTRPPKSDKSWAPERPHPRRIGVEPALATVFNVHSREAVPLFSESLLPQKALRRITACRGFGEQRDLDPRLFAITVSAAVHFEAPRVELISGYRSPKFNDTLTKKGRAVAAESRHTRGEALDLRLWGVPSTKVGAFMFENFEGGVGTYSRDDFVHIDVGPKRRWQGR